MRLICAINSPVGTDWPPGHYPTHCWQQLAAVAAVVRPTGTDSQPAQPADLEADVDRLDFVVAVVGGAVAAAAIVAAVVVAAVAQPDAVVAAAGKHHPVPGSRADSHPIDLADSHRLDTHPHSFQPHRYRPSADSPDTPDDSCTCPPSVADPASCTFGTPYSADPTSECLPPPRTA